MKSFFQSHSCRYFTLAGLSLLLVISLTLLGSQPALARTASLEPVSWYVATTGSDSNDCLSPATPCASINGAIAKAADGDTIMVAVGTYTAASGTEVVLIEKDLLISGGWNAAFDTQSGLSTIDGGGVRRGVVVNASITATISDVKVEKGFHEKFGGGIYSEGTLTLTNSTISNNVSDWMGGGIFIRGGTMTINNSVIRNNFAGLVAANGGGGGAGIENDWGNLTVNNSSITGNKIRGYFNSSAIDSNYATLTLNNTTISGNYHDNESDAQALFIRGGTASINNSTITANDGYGIYDVSGNIYIQNSIIAGNTGTSDCYNNTDYDGIVKSYGYNLIGKRDGCGFIATTGDKVGTISSPINARLSPLSNFGGQSYSHALHSDSPALDAGNPAVPGSSIRACLATDQHGTARPQDNACDIGAHEGYVTFVKSIKRINPNPTSARSVSFLVTFSDAVTGVNTSSPFSDFSLTTIGLKDASVTSVSGTGNTYTVTVSTGLGADSVRLDVVDDDSILDSRGKPLGGAGAGNGRFVSGETYKIKQPYVVSIRKASPNPTSAFTVKYTLTFSEPVTGVDTSAPFSDFTVNRSGLTSSKVIAVTGSGTTYTVSVSVGSLSEDGTARLDLIDNDSIRNALGRPLGGLSLGDGNFNKSDVYTVDRVPALREPGTIIFDSVPTYSWDKIPGARQYQFEVWKGTKLVEQKIVMQGSCGATSCQYTTPVNLTFSQYKWRVRPMIRGKWMDFTALKLFTLIGITAGQWTGRGIQFYVSPSKLVVNNFAVYIDVYGCGSYKITNPYPVTIANGKFSFTGNFYFTGMIDDRTNTHGTLGFDSYYIPGCGTIHGGPISWNASWLDNTQPAFGVVEPSAEIILLPDSVDGKEHIQSRPFKIEPIHP